MRIPSLPCASSTSGNLLQSTMRTMAPILTVRSAAVRLAIHTPLQLPPGALLTFQNLLKGQMGKEPGGVGKGKSGGRRRKVMLRHKVKLMMKACFFNNETFEQGSRSPWLTTTWWNLGSFPIHRPASHFIFIIEAVNSSIFSPI